MTVRFEIPAYYCPPPPSRSHPHAKAIEQRSSEPEAAATLGKFRNTIVVLALGLADRVREGPYGEDTIAVVHLLLGAVRVALDSAQGLGRCTNRDGKSPGAIELLRSGITPTLPTDDLQPPPFPAVRWRWSV